MCSIHNIHGKEGQNNMSNTQAVYDDMSGATVIGALKACLMGSAWGHVFPRNWTGNTKVS